MSGSGVARHPGSMVMTRIGGEDYPLRFEANCHTCQDPNRMQIENWLIEGRSYSVIASEILAYPEGAKPHPSKKSISDHIKNGHLPLNAASERRLIERRAKDVGQNLEEGIDDLVDLVTVNQMIVAKGFTRLQRGEIKVEVGDMLAASKMLHTIEQSMAGGVDEQMWRDALMAYLEVAQQFIPQGAWQEYGKALGKHPVIKAIADAQAAAAQGEPMSA